MSGDTVLEGFENMLFGGALGMFGEYANEEPEGVKGGAAGLKGDFDRGFEGGLLSMG
jgi:hypothetical protein